MHGVGKEKEALDFNTEFIHIIYVCMYIYIYIYISLISNGICTFGTLMAWNISFTNCKCNHVTLNGLYLNFWHAGSHTSITASRITRNFIVFSVSRWVLYMLFKFDLSQVSPVSSFCMFEFIQRFSKHSVLRNTRQPSEVIWETYCQYANSAENQWIYFNGWYILNCHWEFYVPFRYIILMPVDVVWMNSLRDLDGRLNYILMPAFISCIPIPTTEWSNKFA